MKICFRLVILIFFQLVTALIVSWVSMLVGYTSGYTSPADKSLRSDFGIGENEVSNVHELKKTKSNYLTQVHTELYNFEFLLTVVALVRYPAPL